jgi:hypothetical protein
MVRIVEQPYYRAVLALGKKHYIRQRHHTTEKMVNIKEKQLAAATKDPAGGANDTCKCLHRRPKP